MSTRLPSIKDRELIAVLKKIGFFFSHQKGSHAHYYHNDGRMTIVPRHPSKDLNRSLLHTILKQIKITKQEFIDLL